MIDDYPMYDDAPFRVPEATRRDRVVFRAPVAVELETTVIGTAVGWHLSPEAKLAVRAQLEGGPFIAAVDAQIDLLEDIYAHEPGRIRLVTVEDAP